jgi:O-antigen ligase
MVEQLVRRPSESSDDQRTILEPPLLRVARYVLTAYMASAPVSWLPGVGVGGLARAKLGIAAFGCALVWTYAVQRGRGIHTPARSLIALGVVILAAGFAFAQGHPDIVTHRVLDFVFGISMLWTFYLLLRLGGKPFRALGEAGIIIALLGLITISSLLFQMPNWESPTVFMAKPLWAGGFGSTRTSWSNGIALFLPCAFAFLAQRRDRARFVGLAAVSVGILGSQVVSGGRAGLLGATFGLLFVSWKLLSRRSAIALWFAGAVGAFLLSPYLAVQLRFTRLSEQTVMSHALDRFSAGRLKSSAAAIRLAEARPLTGYGFGQTDLRYVTNARDIHNLWLRLLVDGGVFLPLAFLFFTGIVARSAFQCLSLHRRSSRSGMVVRKPTSAALVALPAVFGSGVLVTLFEPNYLLGTFQISAVWWAGAGVLLATPLQIGARPERSQKQQTLVLA